MFKFKLRVGRGSRTEDGKIDFSNDSIKARYNDPKNLQISANSEIIGLETQLVKEINNKRSPFESIIPKPKNVKHAKESNKAKRVHEPETASCVTNSEIIEHSTELEGEIPEESLLPCVAAGSQYNSTNQNLFNHALGIDDQVTKNAIGKDGLDATKPFGNAQGIPKPMAAALMERQDFKTKSASDRASVLSDQISCDIMATNIKGPQEASTGFASDISRNGGTVSGSLTVLASKAEEDSGVSRADAEMPRFATLNLEKDGQGFQSKYSPMQGQGKSNVGAKERSVSASRKRNREDSEDEGITNNQFGRKKRTKYLIKPTPVAAATRDPQLRITHSLDQALNQQNGDNLAIPKPVL